MLLDVVRDACVAFGDGPIGVACSGGADSVALLHLVTRAHRGAVHALHVDHGLRADSADDAAFVETLAAALQIPFASRRVDVARTASIEAAARDARYRALSEMAEQVGLVAVFTAHTLDDQAETVLLRVMRGDSLDAIAPYRGIFHRPLLDVRREQLRAFLRGEGLPWREDPTNTDTRFERNWVRGVLLPQLEQRRTGVSAVLARVASDARDDEHFLEDIATRTLDTARRDAIGTYVADVDRMPSAIARRVVRAILREHDVDPTRDEVQRVLRGEHRVIADVDVWTLDGGRAFIPRPMQVPADLHVGAGAAAQSSQWGITVHADADVIIRARRPGDRVQMSAGTKKVQDVLVDAKVPRPLRALVPIVSDGGDLAILGPRLHGRLASCTVFEVEPFKQTWSQEMAWNSR